MNRVVIACAGSGKTTYLVKEALGNSLGRIGFVTYTNNNARQIVSRFEELNGGVPRHVDVSTWFGFLLRECARPYRKFLYPQARIESVFFVNQQSALRVPETNVVRHFFAKEGLIYSDKLSKFIVRCEAVSGGKVTARLREIYSDLYVDEFQDLAGWDLDLVELLLRSGPRITIVGDPRQHTYSTVPSLKNKQYQGVGVMRLVEQWRKAGLCSLESFGKSRRCHQRICDFANMLWPGLEPMASISRATSDHEGVFLVRMKDVRSYIGRFHPQILRYSQRSESFGNPALNFGQAKGLEFERVLIVPTKPIAEYLSTGDIAKIANSSKDKLHVAITRARQSVAFVYDGDSPIVQDTWEADI